MMKKLMYVVPFLVITASALLGGAASVSLKQGWNAIGTNSETTLIELKNQLGSQLLNVQSPDGTKTYSSTSTRTPSFVQFEIGTGYWVKVSANTTLVVTEKALSGDQNVSIKSGWNLIDPLNVLTLDEIKQQLGSKLLNIQSPDGTKTYSSTSTRTPSFVQFEDGLGYWIKSNADTSLKFTFASLLTNVAVNGQLNQAQATYSPYTLKIMTDALSPSLGSNISVYAKINNVDIGNILSINASYPVGSNFKVQVLNSTSQVLAESTTFQLTQAMITATEVDVGNITVVDSNGTIDTPPTVPDINTSTPLTPPPSVPTI